MKLKQIKENANRLDRLTNTKIIHSWLRNQNIEDYNINDDYSVDVHQDVQIVERVLPYLPVKFRNVKDFSIKRCGLKSLKNMPEKVSGKFSIYQNDVTSLQGMPKEVTHMCEINNNKIKSMDNFNCKVGSLNASNLPLTNLKNIHKQISMFDYSGSTVQTWFRVVETPLQSNILGLLLVKGLEVVYLDNLKVQDILNHHLNKDRDINLCQEDLIEAGYPEFAKL